MFGSRRFIGYSRWNGGKEIHRNQFVDSKALLDCMEEYQLPHRRLLLNLVKEAGEVNNLRVCPSCEGGFTKVLVFVEAEIKLSDFFLL